MTSESKTDYRKLTDELEQISTKLQAGDLEINEAIELYSRGQKIIEELETYLKSAENTIKRLKVD